MENNNIVNEIKITVPEGYEIDKENSTFEKIVFRKIEKTPWRYRNNRKINGCWINNHSEILGTVKSLPYIEEYHNIFATRKQAKSALAMAQITQIMANDKRFGGIITENEWVTSGDDKHVIYRVRNNVIAGMTVSQYHFLAFHTAEQRDLFLKENEDLVKDYLMID